MQVYHRCSHGTRPLRWQTPSYFYLKNVKSTRTKLLGPRPRITRHSRYPKNLVMLLTRSKIYRSHKASSIKIPGNPRMFHPQTSKMVGTNIWIRLRHCSNTGEIKHRRRWPVSAIVKKQWTTRIPPGIIEETHEENDFYSRITNACANERLVKLSTKPFKKTQISRKLFDNPKEHLKFATECCILNQDCVYPREKCAIKY